MKVIVTGSRDWPYPAVVDAELYKLWDGITEENPYILVQGGCPTGADKFAKDWFSKHNMDIWFAVVEEYPADWNKYGKAAGPKRNMQMVDDNLDADLVLAFWYAGSKGTRQCFNYAADRGLPVKVIEVAVYELGGKDAKNS